MFINDKLNYNSQDMLHSGRLDLFPSKTSSNERSEDSTKESKEDLKKALDQLDKLIGLEDVKQIVKQYIAFVQIQKLRASYGLKKLPVVTHMIFKGNPGTGKTTVARLLSDIFKSLGYLDTGQFIEVERVDLVGEYIGHTAKKTREMIKKAIGGILFIDEAYSLARGGEKDFGKESIDTLVKAMEDYKDNLIIIMAGYKEEMEEFLNTNPGLKSRFSLHFNFKDYTINELLAIALLMFEEREYKLMERSNKYLYRLISLLINDKSNNGNARMIRNLVEKSIKFQANRVIEKSVITKNDLMLIKKDDLIQGFRQEIDKIC